MERFSVIGMYEIARAFEQLRAGANLMERFGNVRFSGPELSPNNMESIELLSVRSRINLPDWWILSVSKTLTTVEQQCELVGMQLAAKAAQDLRSGLASGRIATYGDASEAIAALDKILVLQLREVAFMFIPSDRYRFYSCSQLFGTHISGRFPTCAHDIQEAGNCLATDRTTACVFHLMRVMEVAVQEFGTALGVALTGEKNWQNILDEVNKRIKLLPPKSDRTVALCQVAGHLFHVKIAWRNPTMHPKAVYSFEEANQLLSAVNAFMSELVAVI